ncbi:hypothetical protein HPB49_022055 [Dermacentor silvarum]|uniref:Uncharacterized protein n=1 Tax=Dermacentor silvarum TaxID=543639 RepID=A0ACB8DRG0_DERSI|nr:hypothetical protein HPB49_022055 [Dermacentor silvarum]
MSHQQGQFCCVSYYTRAVCPLSFGRTFLEHLIDLLKALSGSTYSRSGKLSACDPDMYRVSVTLRSQHSTKETTIGALEVPEISAVTSPPADGAIVTMMTHCGLVPADARSVATIFLKDVISILIGSDLYWEIVTGQIIQLSPQVTAVQTLSGWTIHGMLHDLSKGSGCSNHITLPCCRRA